LKNWHASIQLDFRRSSGAWTSTWEVLSGCSGRHAYCNVEAQLDAMYGLKIIMLRLFLLRYIERRQHHRMVLAAFTVAVTVTNSLSTYRPRRSLPQARSQIRFFLALFILSQTHHRQPQVGGEAVPAVRLDYFLFGFKEQSWSTGRDRSQAGLLGLPWSTDHITTYPIQPAYLPSHPANLSPV
jgi:hypothetical protein